MSKHSRIGAPADRARGVAAEYRNALINADPKAAARLDAAAEALGESWIVARFEPLPVGDQWLSRKEVAAIARVDPDTVTTWTHRGISRGGRYLRLRRYQAGYSSSEVRDFLHLRSGESDRFARFHTAESARDFDAASPTPLRRVSVAYTDRDPVKIGRPGAQSSTCLIELPGAGECGGTVVPGSPLPLCLTHGIEMWRFYAAALDEPERVAEAVAAIRADEAAARGGTRGCVYYVRIGEFIKIGFTANLRHRLDTYPPDAVVLAVEPGGKDLEAQRLGEFALYRAARREWFQPGPRLVDHIAQLAEGRSA